MFNLQLIFGNQYLEETPAENLAETDASTLSPASEQKDPCCRAVKRSDCCESTH
jgi:hypothetical protein